MTIKEAFDRGLIKVGTRILTRADSLRSSGEKNRELLVNRVDPGNKMFYSEIIGGVNKSWCITKDNSSEVIIKDHETIMSDIIEFFKNIALTEDEKLLKEMGIENPTGEPTTAGLELSALISYKANKKEIIETAKKMKEEEEKKEKKK